ncbi:hypothetical protein THRCLA_11409 [Thraustotheca clavata]|uniref:Ras-specific guanine nucleotide-releasing factor n=1 Tax=Thraustotheca clavata TaxID=74557 RepID=A0A1V9Y7U0_9STRA|nr:hypothetical protein THRCLA_11409 [Thraustotheca clavata]
MSALIVGPSGRGLLRDLWSFEDDEEHDPRPSDVGSTRSSSIRSPNPLLMIQTHDTESEDELSYGTMTDGIRKLSFTASPTNILKQGWLVKRGHNWHTWKLRWFVLYRDSCVKYYRNQKMRKVKGSLRLDDGIVKVQFADTYYTKHSYSFQVVKGYYILLCSCTSKHEADDWVHALRRVRTISPTDTEGPVRLTAIVPNESEVEAKLTESRNASVIKRQIELFSLRARTVVSGTNPMTPPSLLRFVGELETQIMQSILISTDPNTRMAVRYYIEDKVFFPLIELFYTGLNDTLSSIVVPSASHINQLRNLPFNQFNSKDIDCSFAIASLSAIDTVSLPSHKLWILMESISWIDETLTSSFDEHQLRDIVAHCVIHASFDNLAVTSLLLKTTHLILPRSGHQHDSVYMNAFLSALAYLHSFDPSKSNGSSFPVLSIPFSTAQVGIQLGAYSGDRGAVLMNIRKHSQASLCPSLGPDLVLIGVNVSLVVQLPLAEIVECLRNASLPKQLVFMTDAEYEKLLLTHDINLYLACLAASRGDVQGLKMLMEENPDLNIHRQCEWDPNNLLPSLPWLPPSHGTILHAAVANGQGAMVSALLDDLNIDPQMCNASGDSALHVLNTHIAEIAPSLAGVINKPDRFGRTPLMIQCSQGSMEGVVTLLGLGANINAIDWASGSSALLDAVHRGHFDIVDVCLLKGANVRHTNYKHESALHIAARIGHTRLMRRLIQGGADIATQESTGQTAAAVLLQQDFSTNILLDGLALLVSPLTLEISDLWGRHLVHFASQRNAGLKESMEFLLGHGANGHAEDIFGDSPREYRKHPKDHGIYVAPTAYMKHLYVTLASTEHNRVMLQSGRIDDIFAFLVAEKSMNLKEMVSFVLNCTTYIEIIELVRKLESKLLQGNTTFRLKKAWSVVAGANFQRENTCGAVFFLIIAAYFYPNIVESSEFDSCWHTITHDAPLTKPVRQYLDLLNGFYHTTPKTSLYSDLHDHMIDMYSSKPQYQGSRQLLSHLQLNKINPLEFAKQCTILAHAVFSKIPIRQLMLPKCNDTSFLTARYWFQHLSALVINYVLMEQTSQDRAQMIAFFIDVAEICFESLKNFDSFIAILYALQSTAIFRLKRTFACMSPDATKKLQKYQLYTQNGSRDMNRVMKTISPPCMPYIGLYLQNIVGLNELPKYEEESIVNFNRLRLLGTLAQDLLSYQSTSYPFQSNHMIEQVLHVDLRYPTDETRYDRSHALETRQELEEFEATEAAETNSSRDSSESIFPRLRFSSISSRRDRTSSISCNFWV